MGEAGKKIGKKNWYRIMKQPKKPKKIRYRPRGVRFLKVVHYSFGVHVVGGVVEISSFTIKTNPRNSQPLLQVDLGAHAKARAKSLPKLFSYDFPKLVNCTVVGQDIFKLRKIKLNNFSEDFALAFACAPKSTCRRGCEFLGFVLMVKLEISTSTLPSGHPNRSAPP